MTNDADIDDIETLLEQLNAKFDLDAQLADGRLTITRAAEPTVEAADADSSGDGDKQFDKESIESALQKLAADGYMVRYEGADKRTELSAAEQEILDAAREADNIPADEAKRELGLDETDDHEPPSQDVSSEDDEHSETSEPTTKREQRIQRLQDGIEDGTPYTGEELVAIAYDKAVADATATEKAYVSNLRREDEIELADMDDPFRSRGKLYYRGSKPDIDPDSTDSSTEKDSEQSVEDEQTPKAKAEAARADLDADETDSEREDADESAYECDECGKQYEREHWYLKHVASCDGASETSESTAEPEVACDECGKALTRRGAGPHLQQAHGITGAGTVDTHTTPLTDTDPGEASGKSSETEASTAAETSGDSSRDDATAADGDCDCPTDEDGEPVHTADCPEYVTQEVEQMTRDAIRDELRVSGIKETAMKFDVDQDLVQEIHDTAEGEMWYDETADEPAHEDAADELLDETTEMSLGRIMLKGEFTRYECQECGSSFTKESRASDHSDEEGHLSFKAFRQKPKRQHKRGGYIGGGTAR